MMIQMFPGGLAPLFAAEFAEDGVFAVADRCFGKPTQFIQQGLFFGFKIFFLSGHHIGLVCGQSLFIGGLVIQGAFEEREEEAHEPVALHGPFAQGDGDGFVYVGQHLGRVHFAPLAGGIVTETVDAGEDLLFDGRVEHIFYFHGRGLAQDRVKAFMKKGAVGGTRGSVIWCNRTGMLHQLKEVPEIIPPRQFEELHL